MFAEPSQGERPRKMDIDSDFDDYENSPGYAPSPVAVKVREERREQPPS